MTSRLISIWVEESAGVRRSDPRVWVEAAAGTEPGTLFQGYLLKTFEAAVTLIVNVQIK